VIASDKKREGLELDATIQLGLTREGPIKKNQLMAKKRTEGTDATKDAGGDLKQKGRGGGGKKAKLQPLPAIK